MKATLERWIAEIEEMAGGWVQPPACLAARTARLLSKLKEIEVSYE